MKIYLKLPGGGELYFEKKPMSKEARFTLEASILFFGCAIFFLVVIWLLR